MALLFLRSGSFENFSLFLCYTSLNWVLLAAAHFPEYNLSLHEIFPKMKWRLSSAKKTKFESSFSLLSILFLFSFVFGVNSAVTFSI